MAHSKRIKVKTVSGQTLSILVERESQPGLFTFPYVAVLNDWDEGCKYQNGKTPFDAVDELLVQLDEEAAEDFRYIDAFFADALPCLLRRQAG